MMKIVVDTSVYDTDKYRKMIDMLGKLANDVEVVLVEIPYDVTLDEKVSKVYVRIVDSGASMFIGDRDIAIEIGKLDIPNISFGE